MRLLQDIQIGIPRSQALENLLDRTDVADLRGFVHAFTHAERYGIPIAQVLRTQSSDLREKRRQRAEEHAMKIPVKLTFPLVLCILPALFIVVAGSGRDPHQQLAEVLIMTTNILPFASGTATRGRRAARGGPQRR